MGRGEDACVCGETKHEKILDFTHNKRTDKTIVRGHCLWIRWRGVVTEAGLGGLGQKTSFSFYVPFY